MHFMYPLGDSSSHIVAPPHSNLNSCTSHCPSTTTCCHRHNLAKAQSTHHLCCHEAALQRHLEWESSTHIKVHTFTLLTITYYFPQKTEWMPSPGFCQALPCTSPGLHLWSSCLLPPNKTLSGTCSLSWTIEQT